MTEQNGSAVPPSAPVAPGPPPSRGAGMPMWAIVLIILVPIVVLVLACGGIFSAIMFPAIFRAREAAQRASCAANLKHVAIVCKMYANEHDGYYPPLAKEPGRFTFELSTVYPEYLTDAWVMVCPSNPDAPPQTAPPATLIDDHSYIYLGYAVTNEEEGMAFLDTYQRRVQEGLPLEGDLDAPAGKGSHGSDKFLAVREGTERVFVDPDRPETYPAFSEIPIMFDRQPYHPPGGCNVMYMDGHVEFVRINEKFPVTEPFLKAIEDLERDVGF